MYFGGKGSSKYVERMREKYGDAELQNLMEQKNNLYYKLSVGEVK